MANFLRIKLYISVCVPIVDLGLYDDEDFSKKNIKGISFMDCVEKLLTNKSENKNLYSDFGNIVTILFNDSIFSALQNDVFPDPDKPSNPIDSLFFTSNLIPSILLIIKLSIFIFYFLQK